MTYLSCPVPGCTHYFYHRDTLDAHLKTYHSIAQGSGFYEAKQEMPNSDPKAPQHLINSIKNELKNTERKPIQANIPLPTPQKSPLQLLPNWHHGMDGSLIYEQKVGEHNTPLSSSVMILKAKISGNHFLLTSYTYTKDLREIALQEEKRNTFESRLQGLTISDNAFVEVAKAIQETDRKLRDLRNGLSADSEIAHPLEDFYRGEIGTEDYDNWRKTCMEKTNSELSQLSKNYTSQIDNPTKQ